MRKPGVSSLDETSAPEVIYNRLGDCSDRCIGRESPFVFRIIFKPAALIEAGH